MKFHFWPKLDHLLHELLLNTGGICWRGCDWQGLRGGGHLGCRSQVAACQGYWGPGHPRRAKAGYQPGGFSLQGLKSLLDVQQCLQGSGIGENGEQLWILQLLQEDRELQAELLLNLGVPREEWHIHQNRGSEQVFPSCYTCRGLRSCSTSVGGSQRSADEGPTFLGC